ncbi:MAG: hypothetical protein KTR31_31785 [Myxococcales bacterium]|nr:hypothetical protein [Myxococcales bacterium]
MIWLVTTALAQTTGQTASTATTADTSVGFVRTALHDKLEACHLVVHAEVATSVGVTLLGGKRRWVQTLEVLEVLHENHSRTALSAGDALPFFSLYDDSVPDTVALGHGTAARLAVGEEAVYFLVEATYTDTLSASHDVWSAHRVIVDPHALESSAEDSVVAAVDYGGTTGKIAGRPPAGRAILHRSADTYLWITAPFDPITDWASLRIHADTAADDGMPWSSFLTRVRAAAGQQ